MKFVLILTVLLISAGAMAESPCDVRVGESSGMKVIEFATGNVVHSKINLRESSADALLEEMLNLQDMGICTEKILSQKCVLKFDKKLRANSLTLYRGTDRWLSWAVESKRQAQDYVRNLKRVGFCS